MGGKLPPNSQFIPLEEGLGNERVVRLSIARTMRSKTKKLPTHHEK